MSASIQVTHFKTTLLEEFNVSICVIDNYNCEMCICIFISFFIGDKYGLPDNHIIWSLKYL